MSIKRLSLWQIMLFIAALSGCLAIHDMKRRRDRYMLKAVLRAQAEESYLSEIGAPIVIGICGMGRRDQNDRTPPVYAARGEGYAARDARCRECARYYGAMKKKYLKAASQPWRAAPPDPPPPDA
jgi:hypothetical protein